MSADEIAKLAAAFVGLMSVLATMTPNSSRSKALQFVLDVINAFAMNLGRAKNAK